MIYVYYARFHPYIQNLVNVDYSKSLLVDMGRPFIQRSENLDFILDASCNDFIKTKYPLPKMCHSFSPDHGTLRR
jgi:hypothetical protein